MAVDGIKANLPVSVPDDGMVVQIVVLGRMILWIRQRTLPANR